jgi:hypothetical protein
LDKITKVGLNMNERKGIKTSIAHIARVTCKKCNEEMELVGKCFEGCCFMYGCRACKAIIEVSLDEEIEIP